MTFITLDEAKEYLRVDTSDDAFCRREPVQGCSKAHR